MTVYNIVVKLHLNDQCHIITIDGAIKPDHYCSSIYHDPDSASKFHSNFSNDAISEADDNTDNTQPNSFDACIDIELALPCGVDGEMIHVTVKNRKFVNKGKLIG